MSFISCMAELRSNNHNLTNQIRLMANRTTCLKIESPTHTEHLKISRETPNNNNSDIKISVLNQEQESYKEIVTIKNNFSLIDRTDDTSLPRLAFLIQLIVGLAKQSIETSN